MKTTKQDGGFTFESVAAGTYSLRVIPFSSDEVWTTPQGSARTITVATLETSKANFGADGPGATATVHGVVFSDTNYSGKYDQGEPTLPNTKITLFGQSIVTDANGSYSISLPQGTSSLNASGPDEYDWQYLNHRTVTERAGTEVTLNIAAGYLYPSTFVFFLDTNANKSRDADEPPLRIKKLLYRESRIRRLAVARLII